MSESTPPTPSVRVDPADAEFASLPEPTRQAASSRRLTVFVHMGLLVVVGLVVLSTMGRDPRSKAAASVSQPVLEASPMPATIAAMPAAPVLEAPVSEVVPHLSASPERVLARAMGYGNLDQGVNAQDPQTTEGGTLEPEPVADSPLSIPAREVEPHLHLALAPEKDPLAAWGGAFGTPGASRIVYLVDASGSMVDTMPVIQHELQRAVANLRPDQRFSVIFFADDRLVEAPPVGMKTAGTEALARVIRWLDPQAGTVIPHGKPEPASAIRRALAYQPDAIILLSDGLTDMNHGLAERAGLIELVQAANTARTTFHTVQLRQPDPLASETRHGTLEAISLLTGGVFRYVPDERLTMP